MDNFGIYRPTPPTLTDGQQSQFSVDSAGRLQVVAAGSGTGGATQVEGFVANGIAAAGNSVPQGGKAVSAAAPTAGAVTAGQRADAVYTLWGAPYVCSTFRAATSDDVPDANAALTIMGDGTVAGRLMVRMEHRNPATGLWDRILGDKVSTFTRMPPRAKTNSALTAASASTQQLFAANASRSKLLIQNQDAAINIFVNLGAAATAGANSLRIAPGATLELTGTNDVVNIIAASGTPAICAWEM